jgi:hypothetical protein
MFTNEFNPKMALRMAKIIYFALISGLLLFLAITLYFNKGKYYFSTDLSDPFLIALFVLACTAIPAGMFVSRMSFNNPETNEPLRNKFSRYQVKLIMKMATSEGVGLFSIVCFLMKPNLIYLFFLFIALYLMFFNYPTPEKIGRELNLQQYEIDSMSE